MMAAIISSRILRLLLRSFAAAALCCIFQVLPAQSKQLDEGQAAFERGDYATAADNFRKALGKKFSKAARLGLAESYRLGQQPELAAEQYAKIVLLQEIPEYTYLRYGQALLQTGNTREAERWFRKQAAETPSDPRAELFLASVRRYADFYADSARFQAEALSSNTPGPDLAPHWYKDALHLFQAADRSENVRWAWPYAAEVRFMNAADPKGELVELETGLDEHLRAGMAWEENVDMVLFSCLGNPREKLRSSDAHKETLRIYYADIKDGAWGLMKAMPFNSSEYSVGHPALGPDGRSLYFVSDMPGGLGGTDIYRSLLQDGFWSEPENLGVSVNSPGDEFFPSFGPSGELYFSSDGHGGMGGLDIWWTREKAGRWSPPVNPGAPFNSNANDFSISYVPFPDVVYVASDRTGHGDIYRVSLGRAVTAGGVLLVEPEAAGDPLADAAVETEKEVDGGKELPIEAWEETLAEVEAKELDRVGPAVAEEVKDAEKVAAEREVQGEDPEVAAMEAEMTEDELKALAMEKALLEEEAELAEAERLRIQALEDEKLALEQEKEMLDEGIEVAVAEQEGMEDEKIAGEREKAMLDEAVEVAIVEKDAEEDELKAEAIEKELLNDEVVQAEMESDEREDEKMALERERELLDAEIELAKAEALRAETEMPSSEDAGSIQYSVQLGVFSKTPAQSWVDKLGPYEGALWTEPRGNVTVYRVGRARTRAIAERSLAKLRSQGFADAFIVEIAPPEALASQSSRETGEDLRGGGEETAAVTSPLQKQEDLPQEDFFSEEITEAALPEEPATDSAPDPSTKEVDWNAGSEESTAIEMPAEESKASYFYTVQFGAFSSAPPVAYLNRLGRYRPELLTLPDGKTFRYSVGRYKGYIQTLAVLNDLRDLGFKDVFMTAYQNGERISIAQARKLEMGK